MNTMVQQIGEMSVEFIAMSKFATAGGGKTIATEFKHLIEDISRLCAEIPLSEAAFLEEKIRKVTIWISNDPAAQA